MLESADDEENPFFLLKESTKKHKFTVLIFERGLWCPFDKAYTQHWSSLSVREKGGQLLAITSQDSHVSQETQTKWKLHYQVLSDPNSVLASVFGIYVDKTARQGYESSKGAMVQAGVVILGETPSDVWYKWSVDPSIRNLDGASSRPAPGDILKNIVGPRLEGKEPSNPKIKFHFLNKISDKERHLDSQSNLSSSIETAGGLSNWWSSVRSTSSLSVLVFFRGNWSSVSPFDKPFLKRWSDLLPEVELEGGQVVGLFVGNQEDANNIRLEWDLSFPVFGSPSVRDLGSSLGVTITSEQSGSGYTEAAVLVVRDQKELFSWFSKPTLTNLKGGKMRPDPFDVWPQILKEINPEQHQRFLENGAKLPEKIHYGCPMSKVGWKQNATPGKNVCNA